MARTALAVQTAGPHGAVLDDITFTAADATNDHEFVNSGREVLLMKNDDASPHTATVVSVTDERGRTGDETITCGASDICIVPFLDPSVWNQRATADKGKVFVDLTVDTSVSFAVVRIT
jgi:hypothetical protein